MRGIRPLKLQTEPRSCEIRVKQTVARFDDAVEQQVIAADVVVEVLEVTELGHAAAGM